MPIVRPVAGYRDRTELEPTGCNWPRDVQACDVRRRSLLAADASALIFSSLGNRLQCMYKPDRWTRSRSQNADWGRRREAPLARKGLTDVRAVALEFFGQVSPCRRYRDTTRPTAAKFHDTASRSQASKSAVIDSCVSKPPRSRNGCRLKATPRARHEAPEVETFELPFAAHRVTRREPRRVMASIPSLTQNTVLGSRARRCIRSAGLRTNSKS